MAALIFALFIFAIYIAFSANTSPLAIVSGIFIALVMGFAFGKNYVRSARKFLQLKRYWHFLVFIFKYFLIDEVKAHLEVIHLILKPSKITNPKIVKLKYDVENEYSVFLLSTCITNTPGTVVVDVDKKQKILYVHWINAKDDEKQISEPFEKYIKKIFE